MSAPCAGQTKSVTYDAQPFETCGILKPTVLSVSGYSATYVGTAPKPYTQIPVIRVVFTCNADPLKYTLGMKIGNGDTDIDMASYGTVTLGSIDFLPSGTDPLTFDYMSFDDLGTEIMPTKIYYQETDSAYQGQTHIYYIYITVSPGMYMTDGTIAFNVSN